MRSLWALVLLATVALAACSPGQPPAVAPSSSAPSSSVSGASAPLAGGGSATPGGCATALTISPLPVWARAGFQPPARPMPHVMGARGSIVAILWARRDALHSPPLAYRANKILWVSRLGLQPSAPLRIRATLNGTRRTVDRQVPYGPGPSYVNLPAAGCWTLALSWSGHRDRVELHYVAG